MPAAIIRWGGLACLVGGLLQGVKSIADRNDPMSLRNDPTDVVFLVAPPLIVVGLVALYLRCGTYQEGPGKTGRRWILAGPVMLIAGFLMFSFQQTTLSAFGLSLFVGGLLLLTCGLVLVGIANVRTGLLGRWGVAPLIIGVMTPLLSITGGGAANSSPSPYQLAYLVVSLLWSLGWVLLGYSLWNSPGTRRDHRTAAGTNL